MLGASNTSIYDSLRRPGADAVVVIAELSGAASRHHHHRLVVPGLNRTSRAAGEGALKDVKADPLAFLLEGSRLAAGATPARIVSKLQLLPPDGVSDSLANTNLSAVAFDQAATLPGHGWSTWQSSPASSARTSRRAGRADVQRYGRPWTGSTAVSTATSGHVTVDHSDSLLTAARTALPCQAH